MSDGGRTLLNHGDVDGIGDRANVGDLLAGEDALKRETSLAEPCFPGLDFEMLRIL